MTGPSPSPRAAASSRRPPSRSGSSRSRPPATTTPTSPAGTPTGRPGGSSCRASIDRDVGALAGLVARDAVCRAERRAEDARVLVRVLVAAERLDVAGAVAVRQRERQGKAVHRGDGPRLAEVHFEREGSVALRRRGVEL